MPVLPFLIGINLPVAPRIGGLKSVRLSVVNFLLSRFINDMDRFMHAATFGEGERFAYTRELMAVVRAVFLGQIEGRPMGVARLSRHLAMPRATTERKLRELQKRGLVSRYGRGFIIPVDSLNQPRMVETLERLILMIHRASAKLPKTGLNEANGD